MNLWANQIAWENPSYWKVNQLFSGKSKLKYLLKKNLKIPILFCKNIFNKSDDFHQRTDWINSVRKQDLWVSWKSDNISSQERLVNFFWDQLLVANTHYLETIQLLNRKDGFKANTRIGPVLEITTSFQQFKFGVEVRIPSVKEDNSQSWVRISFGTVRYVNNYIKYDTQNLESPQEEQDVPASSEVVAARSKAKAKPQPRESPGTTTIPLSERVWIDIEPSKQDLESYNLSKKVINLLRHNQKLHREQDGAVQFYEIKFHLRDYSLPIQNWSDGRWLACLAAGGGPKRRYQYCSDYLGSIISLRAHSRTFWGQSRWSCVTRQCVDWTWDISIHLSRRKQFQS